MKDNQEYNNGRQLHIEDYLQENKLETEGHFSYMINCKWYDKLSKFLA